MTGIRFIGIDTETTGLDILAGHVPIQAGVALRDADGKLRFAEMPIWHEEGSYTWQPKAFEVNGSSPDIVSSADNMGFIPELVDSALVEFLGSIGGSDGRCVPTGWNVGSFDWPFIVEWLPHTAGFFATEYGPAHQFADLNSILFAMQAAGHSATKRSIHDLVEERLAVEEVEGAWHAAGWDAAASLVAFEYMIGEIGR